MPGVVLGWYVLSIMEVTIEHIGTLPVVVVSGRMDTSTAPAFDAQVAPMLAEPRKNILVDMGGVTYMSSAGLRSLLQLVKHTAVQAGRVGLFGAPPSIMEVVEISGFPALLDVYADRATALSVHAS